jgi:hypothetical protein
VDRNEIRRLSKGLTGNAYRVEIACAIGRAKTEIVTALTLAKALSVPHNLVSKQLKDFVTIGIMENVPDVEGQRFRYFRRLETPYWEVMGTLFDRLTGSPIPGTRASGPAGDARESGAPPPGDIR